MKIFCFGQKLRSEILCSARQLLLSCRHSGHLRVSDGFRRAVSGISSRCIAPLRSQSIGYSLGRCLSSGGFNQDRRALSGLTVVHNTIMARSYEDAVNTLNTLQSNASVIEKMKQERERHRIQSLPEMKQMLQRVGLTLEDIDKLSVIHVSGTKGKGSTCAFCDSILRAHGLKTGFYSSPHLVEVRERMRINGRSLSREAFTHYFWECYDRLTRTKDEYGGLMPAYFRFLTIMAYYVFKHEKVDAAVIEVGIGGEYDCTNIVRNPVVCGVASLGIDHTTILGDTIDKIAWHKAGIFKPGAPAVTVPQPEAALKVLYDRAKETDCPLYVAPPLSEYRHNNDEKMSLGIPGVQQSLNASLALQLCRIWLDSKSLESSVSNGCVSDRTVKTSEHGEAFSLSNVMAAGIGFGLQNCIWPGRCQKIVRPGLTYYLDGAHTCESIEACTAWFLEESASEALRVGGKVKRVLLFNMTGDRQAQSLLSFLLKCNFDYAVFCTNVQSSEANHPDSQNRTVSYESQMRRCVDNRKVWLELCQKKAESENTATGDHVPCVKINQDGNTGTEQTVESSFNNSQLIDQSGDGAGGNPMVGNTFIFETILEGLTCVAGGRDEMVGQMVKNINKSGGGREGGDVSVGADHIQVLCTGSLILVGNILGLIDPDVCDRVVGLKH